jgi:hypothetical protein
MNLSRSINIYNCWLGNWSTATNLQSTENTLSEYLPKFKKHLLGLLKQFSKIRVDYLKDNYQEQYAPAVILMSKEHEAYVEST